MSFDLTRGIRPSWVSRKLPCTPSVTVSIAAGGIQEVHAHSGAFDAMDDNVQFWKFHRRAREWKGSPCCPLPFSCTPSRDLEAATIICSRRVGGCGTNNNHSTDRTVHAAAVQAASSAAAGDDSYQATAKLALLRLAKERPGMNVGRQSKAMSVAVSRGGHTRPGQMSRIPYADVPAQSRSGLATSLASFTPPIRQTSISVTSTKSHLQDTPINLAYLCPICFRPTKATEQNRDRMIPLRPSNTELSTVSTG